MSKLSEKKQEQVEAIQHLRKLLKPGSTVYAYIDSVSKSGMSRTMRLFVIGKYNGKPELMNITYWICKACDYRNKDGALYVQGCGMDMIFSVVYTVSRTLWPKGAKIGRGGKPDNDGGYALNYRQI